MRCETGQAQPFLTSTSNYGKIKQDKNRHFADHAGSQHLPAELNMPHAAQVADDRHDHDINPPFNVYIEAFEHFQAHEETEQGSTSEIWIAL